MGETAKQINNGDFKDTIRMTLTTGGQLGVGVIDPKWTITSAGVVQARSATTLNPLASGVGLTGKSLTIGLDTWNVDVHTLIGQVTSDGSNNGCIQVTAGGIGSNSFGATAYGLSLQPSGGNVGIGMTQATSRLQVNGTIRTDVDFVTGTDNPGWEYHSLGTFDVKCELGGNFNNCSLDNLSNANLWERPHIMYKIIGKTAFINFYFRISATGWGPNGGGIYVLLPPALQAIQNIHAVFPNALQAWGDTVGFHDGTPLVRNFTFRIQPRKYVNGAHPNQWIMVLEHTYYGGSNVSSTGGVSDNVGGFRGQCIVELV